MGVARPRRIQRDAAASFVLTDRSPKPTPLSDLIQTTTYDNPFGRRFGRSWRPAPIQHSQATSKTGQE